MSLKEKCPPRVMDSGGLEARGCISHPRTNYTQDIEVTSPRQARSYIPLRLSQSASGESRWARTRPGSSNRNRGTLQGHPGTGPVVDPALPQRPGPQATHKALWSKARASQARRMANTSSGTNKSQGMRCAQWMLRSDKGT